jgi:hypothetical protein
MTGEQQDHAMALWLLWKQHSKAQQRQQQQCQAMQEQQQRSREQAQQQGQAEPAAADVLGDLDSLTLEGAGSSSSSQQQQLAAAGMRIYSRDEIAQMLVQGKLTGEAQRPPPTGGKTPKAANDGCRSSAAPSLHSALHLDPATWQLTTRDAALALLCACTWLHCYPDELRELWAGPQGVEQRAAREVCLAAAGGDLQDVQVRTCQCTAVTLHCCCLFWQLAVVSV